MILFRSRRSVFGLRGSKRIAKLRNKIRHKKCLIVMVGSLVFGQRSVSAIENDYVGDNDNTRTQPEISKVLNNDSSYLQDGDLVEPSANTVLRVILEATKDVKSLYYNLDTPNLTKELAEITKIQPQTISLLKKKHQMHIRVKHLLNTKQVVDSFFSEYIYNKILDIYALPGLEGAIAINELDKNSDFQEKLSTFKRVRELVIERIDHSLSGTLPDLLPACYNEGIFKNLLAAQDNTTADLFRQDYMQIGSKYMIPTKVNIVKLDPHGIKKLLYKNIIIYFTILILTLLLTILIRKLKAHYRKRITKKYE
tara:strand:- start:66 stop:995 length:930 start_codon:yes stop_codon:yes gene_type:complete